MKRKFTIISLIACCFLLASCIFSSEKTYEELGSGFYIKTTTYVPGIDAAPEQELRYRDSRGKDRLVWKHVTGPGYAQDGIAVFIGLLDNPDSSSGTAYLAAKGGGPIVSLAKALLTRTAKQNSRPPKDYLERYVVYELRETDSSLEFEFIPRGIEPKNLQVKLSWSDVSKMTETLIATGTPVKDRISGKDILE